jgi:hypothetical protein
MVHLALTQMKGRTMPAKKRATKKRTTHRGPSGKKLYAKRTATGEFEDIQTYKRAPRRVSLQGWAHTPPAEDQPDIGEERRMGA